MEINREDSGNSKITEKHTSNYREMKKKIMIYRRQINNIAIEDLKAKCDFYFNLKKMLPIFLNYENHDTF